MGEPICAVEGFPVGGGTQWALIRGVDRNLPVLLGVPAGPRFPLIPDANALEAALHWEREFVVVYWDPRGCGKSFGALLPRMGLSLTQYVTDTAEMIQNMRSRLGVARVFLLGFSLGATIGAITASTLSDTLYAFVGVGMDVDWPEADKSAYAFLHKVAQERMHERALRDVAAIGNGPVTDAKRFHLRAKWLAEFGGFYRKSNYRKLVFRQVRRIMACRYYTVRNRIAAFRGMRVVADLMLPELAGIRLSERVRRLDVPVSLFQGRHDPLASAAVAERYFVQLGAPRGKELMWFESSAHMPQDDEPGLFRAALCAVRDKAISGPLK